MTENLSNYTASEWRAEAERLFGADEMKWKFRCPACKHEATIQDYKDAGAPSTAVAFSCVGRWSGAKREAFDTELVAFTAERDCSREWLQSVVELVNANP